MKRNIPFSPPDISEEEILEVCDTLKSGWITTGPKTKKLEQLLSQYTQTNKTVCLNSATAALELVLRILGVKEGDEVIVPALTYTASCSVICHVGATPVMVDIQEETFEMDYTKLEEAINEKTKVIIPVEIAGIVCDYNKIFEIVERKKELFNPQSSLQSKYGRIVIMSDSAHALGSKFEDKMVGSIADFTCFSFHAVKNFTTAEGGSVTWKSYPFIDDEEMYRQFQIYSLHGQTKDALAKTQLGSWEYDIILPGYKCNMTDIMAAIGLVQLNRYPDLLRRRDEIVEIYDNGFKDSDVVSLNHYKEGQYSCKHLYITHVKQITLQQRNEIIVKMAEKGIACNVHYKPLPLLTAYKNLGFNIDDYPNAYKYYTNTISLPLHTQLTNDEVEYIIDSLLTSIEEVKSGN